MEYPLVTVLILTYRNFRFLFDAIDSVLAQCYPKIELIVSNDHSDDFDELGLINYLNEKRGSNIVKVIVNKNQANMGTVKHANHCLKMASGEYIFFLAADDAIHDEHVLEQFIDHFTELGDDTLLITSQCGMYDMHLKEFIEPALSPEKIHKIKEYSPLEMYRELCHTYTIPAAGTIYRRKFYDIVGFYDEDYFLIEDSPMFAKISRMGIKVPYLEMMSVKHRHGGISHGNHSNKSSVLAYYFKDEILFFEKEYFKHMDMLKDSEIKKAKARYKYLTETYYRLYEFPKLSSFEKRLYVIKNSPGLILKALEKVIRQIIIYSIEIKGKASPSFLITGTILLLLANFTSVSAVTSENVDRFYKVVIVYTGLFCLLFEAYYALLSAVRLFYKILKQTYGVFMRYWSNLEDGTDD